MPTLTDVQESVVKRLQEAPDPTEFPTNYNVRTSTPWGTAQTARQYGRGIVQYSTAGHGGFHVSAGLLEQMPESFKTADSYTDGHKGWFEEDCAWSLVVLAFPERFKREWRAEAVRTAQSYYPQVLEEFCARFDTNAL